MDIVREIQVRAGDIRLDDYVPMGGYVKKIRKRTTGGLFPRTDIILTFYTGEDYVDYTVRSDIPVDIERMEYNVRVYRADA